MAPTASKRATRVIKKTRKSPAPKVASTSVASEKKYRVRLPEKGTLASYTTKVLGRGKMRFVKDKVYVVSLSDARLLRKLELLPGKKVFEISEVMDELEALDVPEESEEQELEMVETKVGEVDLTAVASDDADAPADDESTVVD